jgi:hypothetical protein
LVFVSFGWNDGVRVRRSDRAYRPPGRTRIALQRVLLKYRAYLTLMYYLHAWRERVHGGKPPALQPRVSARQYVENLRAFIETARRHGAKTVLLTRPYRRDLCQDGWDPKHLERVEGDNRALLALAAETGTPVVDVSRIFRTRHPGLFGDSCHFLWPGNIRMAEILAALLFESGFVPLQSGAGTRKMDKEAPGILAPPGPSDAPRGDT